MDVQAKLFILSGLQKYKMIQKLKAKYESGCNFFT